MGSPFQPRGLPVLIGSLPLTDHVAACQLVWEHTPQIPLWIQLPAHKEEGMVAQFMPGMPGICATDAGLAGRAVAVGLSQSLRRTPTR